jgi:hypothetical protein
VKIEAVVTEVTLTLSADEANRLATICCFSRREDQMQEADNLELSARLEKTLRTYIPL